jgi:hypothetical protein
MKMRLKTKRRENNTVSTVIGGAVILGATYLAMRSVPEMIRYLRIRRM